jgi:hypothetical protein
MKDEIIEKLEPRLSDAESKEIARAALKRGWIKINPPSVGLANQAMNRKYDKRRKAYVQPK